MKCPWCGRDGLKLTPKKLLPPHLTAGQQHCVAVGLPPPGSTSRKTDEWIVRSRRVGAKH